MQNSIDISGILSEFRGSLRLRLGIFLVVVILLVWISLVLGDLKKESLQEIDLTLSELIDMQSVADKSFWQEQLEQQVQLANRSGTTIWQGQSPSQIAASLQSKLYAMASENHILAPEISSEGRKKAAWKSALPTANARFSHTMLASFRRQPGGQISGAQL